MPRSLPSLPFHLTLQGTLWASLNAALQQAKCASPNLNANWPNFAGLFPFQPNIQLLEAAVTKELQTQNRNLLEGIHYYLKHPYERAPETARVIWQEGGSRLLDYSVQNEPKQSAIFLVPSLINRYYILDLMEGRSFAAYLHSKNIRVFLIDWGEPSSCEIGFGISDYIGRLSRAFHYIRQHSSTLPIVAGHCMGGLLALGLAQREASCMSGLALLAMPWDFHARGFPRVPLDKSYRDKLESILSRQPILSGDIIQMLFYSANLWVFARKFMTFSGLENVEAEEFVALESWVNDPVSMTAEVARESLIDWVQENRPLRGAWKINGEPVIPHNLSLPIFAACPTQDTIVPPESAEAILPAFPQATVCRPLSGHVGMVAGPRAAKELWEPFHKWFESLPKGN